MEHLSIIYLIFSTHDVQLIWKQYFQLNSHAYTCTKINYIAGEHYWWATGMVVCFFSGPEHQQTDPSSLSDCLEYPLQNAVSSRYIQRCKVRSENGEYWIVELVCKLSVWIKQVYIHVYCYVSEVWNNNYWAFTTILLVPHNTDYSRLLSWYANFRCFHR